MQWKKKTQQRMEQEGKKNPYHLLLQLVPTQPRTWALLKHEIAEIERSAKLHLVRKSLVKKTNTPIGQTKREVTSQGITVLLTCPSFTALQKITNHFFFHKNDNLQTNNQPLVLISGKAQNVQLNFYDLQCLSSLPNKEVSALQLFKQPGNIFHEKLQQRFLVFLKLLRANNEN